jgi:hypothetical protein
MIVRIRRSSILPRSERLLRLQGVSLIALGTATLLIWNPLTQPGPKVCLLRHLVGLPCPLCGMTRGVALCLRGSLREALLFNPLAVPVLVLAMVMAVVWIIEFVGGRRFDVHAPPWLRRGLSHTILLLFLMNWAFLVAYRREDLFETTWIGQLWTVFAGRG